MYYPFVRKALLRFDLERAHEFTFQQLHRITGASFEVLVRQKVPTKPANCVGLTSRNSLSLATGLDKGGECIDALGVMGFESTEISTVAPRPQSGDDRPRLFRLVGTEGLINRMDFNNLGVNDLAENIREAHYDGVLGINIGKNRGIPVKQGKDDYLICMEKVYACVRYITINIPSPNIPKLCTLQYGEALDSFLTVIKNKQDDLQAMYHEYVPIAVKIASNLSGEELIQVADSLIRHNTGGVTITNTVLDRSFTQGMKNRDRTDDLGDRPLQLRSAEIIHRLSLELNSRLPITGVDGVNLVIATCEKIATGASLVQIYSGFIFKSPPLIKGIATHI